MRSTQRVIVNKRGIFMKQPLTLNLLLACIVVSASASAQEPIYRCGNEYTNTKPDARAKGCKLVEGGNFTVIQAVKPSKNAAPKTNSVSQASASDGQRISANEQKARDQDSRLILQEELKKALARREELKKEYNNGEPEKQGPESRNYQKYLDRVAELKVNLARNESDIAGIRRELGRLGGASVAGQ